MAANFCDTCRDIFRGPQRLKEVQPHHQTLHALFVAAESCYICRHVRRAFTEDYASNTKDRSINLEAYLGPVKDFPESWLKLTIEVPMSSQEGLEGDEASDNGADTAVETRAGEASSTAGSDLSDLSVRDTDRDAWDMWGFIVQPAEGKLAYDAVSSLIRIAHGTHSTQKSVPMSDLGPCQQNCIMTRLLI